MALYRFLFAPVLLAVATFLSMGHRADPHARPAAAAPASISAPAQAAGFTAPPSLSATAR